MQLGFVIDHSKCIGCHACTVACKSENDVPLGSFRTWVKYTEEGSFPQVKRSFAVLRCNQCTDAPCKTICPVNALSKGPDGIVDVDPAACIGCKSCMQACPYDAIYLNPDKGTVEKCHFCAHRTAVGLAPACAVVCPTEAIIPGDFHDPESAVSKMRQEHDLTARKTEAGTGPNVLYREVNEATISPLQTNTAGGSIWAQSVPGPQHDAQLFEAMEIRASQNETRASQDEAEASGGDTRARTVYDVAHPAPWGWKITAYLWLKSLAAGAFLVGAAFLAPLRSDPANARFFAIVVPSLALVFLGATLGMLVTDLKRPERFAYILLRPNWDSWLTRGSFILTAYGALLVAWLAFGVLDRPPGRALAWILLLPTVAAGILSAAYTGWLFAQARGRVLWMRRGLWLHLVVQAVLGGAAFLIVALPSGLAMTGRDPLTEFRAALAAQEQLRWILLIALFVDLLFRLTESRMAPAGREEEYARAHRLITHGPYREPWALVGGTLVPAILLVAGVGSLGMLAAGALVLLGLLHEESTLVRAGQAPPIS